MIRRFEWAVVAVISSCMAFGCGGVDSASVPNLGDNEVRVVEELRIGVTAGAPEYLFGSIAHIVQHPDGTIFIADRQVPVIRRYDAEGVYMHDLGGAGEGPGEYRDLQGLKVLPDGNLAIWDVGIRRITVFEPDGAWVKDFQGESGIHTSSLTFQVDHEGNFYLLTTVRRGGNSFNPTTGEVTRGPPPIRGFHRYSPDGELLETIEIPSDESDTPGYVMQSASGFLHNFTTETFSTISSTGHLVVGHNGDYAFEFRDSAAVLVAVDHEWEPVPLTPGEHAQWTAWNEYTTKQMAESPMGAEEFAPIPETKPAFMDLKPGNNGTIWVRRYAEAHERDRPPRPEGDERPPFTWYQFPTWDAFSSEGEFLGAIELPHDTRPVFFETDYIWAIQPNEDEEDVAVRYRIER